MEPQRHEKREARTIRCRRCRESIQSDDTFCRHCGRRQGRFDSKFYQPVWIIVLTLTVLGPLAIPLAWKSPHLTRNGKIAMISFIIGISALVLLLVAYLTIIIFRYYMDMQSQMDDLIF